MEPGFTDTISGVFRHHNFSDLYDRKRGTPGYKMSSEVFGQLGSGNRRVRQIFQ